MKKRIVVVAPGRGSYTKETLGYLQRHRQLASPLISELDQWKAQLNEPTISELDNAKTFKAQVHTKGENASVLIYACAMADFLSINRDEYEVVAVTGNSMGWYIALALAEALDNSGAFEVINTMGSMMKEQIIGGQIIYPLIDENWHFDSKKVQLVDQLLNRLRQSEGLSVYPSIYLGGYIVIGGDQEALSQLMKQLPPEEHFPFQLINHAAFHTPLLQTVSDKALQIFKPDGLFKKPSLPLIDGRGKIWTTYSTALDELFNYTFEHQVLKPYDFTQAIAVALKEFAPDQVFLLGPGNTLGGSIGQILVNERWLGIKSKSDFQDLQKTSPFLVSMGL